MRILSLTLENFGLYAGRQKIDVRTLKKGSFTKPIILIGGKNGSGKTSFLEAVRLALYGKLAIGPRLSQRSYNEYLESRIHTGIDQKSSCKSSIALEFEYAESGILHTYLVSRSWIVDSDAVNESLEVCKDGETFIAIPKEEWQSFLQELLPYGVSQLFFFDGEKITEIAEDADNGQHLSSAIRSLLGIDLVGRLRTDLGLYLAKHQRFDSGQSEDLEKIISEAERLRDELNEVNDQRADLLTKLDSQRRVAILAQQRFSAAGGDIAINRALLIGERDALLKERQELMSIFREGSSNLWVWFAAPKLKKSLIRALSEQQGVSEGESANRLLERFSDWLGSSDQETQQRWTAKHLSDLEKLTHLAGLNRVFDPGLAVFDAATNALSILRGTADQASVAKSFLQRFRHVDQRIATIDFALERIDETKSSFLLEELLSTEKACSQTQGELKILEERLKTLQYKISVVEREHERFLLAQVKLNLRTRQMNLAGRVAETLAKYEKVLITQKVRDLEFAFVDCFNRLIRKSEFVSSVRIDDTTFQVTLITESGTEIPRTTLSAGEKQVFAIAMLWALAKTSGRSFPIIVDTPLARLDSEHRTAIIERYFTEVSHQVIVLSTDTEIDGEMAQKLGPFVSKHLRLDYIPSERRTMVAQGYFTTTEKRVAIDALQ
ncbi:MAG: DNA sulfur modification protein DndD [Moraxellaceae bacterium]|nr:DNA sulfur modification protein DndD [Moraxellaceae bacterium]